MKTRTKHIILAATLTFSSFVVVCAGLANHLAIRVDGQDLFGNTHEIRGSHRTEAIECLLKWARAAPLPSTAEVDSVTKGGSIFTRSFRVTFTAPAEDIEDWLRRSPGVEDAKVTTLRPGIRHFQIKPGEGATFAELTVDDTKQRVILHGYWS